MSLAFKKVRSAAIDGRARNPWYRKLQLQRLHQTLSHHQETIQNALSADIGGDGDSRSVAEVKIQYWLGMRAIVEAYDSIDVERELRDEYAIAKGEDALGATKPVGLVYIDTAAHAFFSCLMFTLAPALTAGNCIIIKTQQTIQKAPGAILSLVQEALDDDLLHVTHTDPENHDIGHRHIRMMQNAPSAHASPSDITSNTKGLAVAIVERDSDIVNAAKAIVRARFSLNGKAPNAPDIVLVNEWVKNDLIRAMVEEASSYLTVATKTENGSAGSSRSVDSAYLDQAVAKGDANIVFSSLSGSILDVQSRVSPLLRQKQENRSVVIYGATSMDDAIEMLPGSSSLAAAFVFSPPEMARYICDFVDATACFVNHIPINLLYGPIIPERVAVSSATISPFDRTLFSLPQPRILKPSPKLTAGLMMSENTSGAASGTDYHSLDADATAKLEPIKRLGKGSGIGFFEQGILTGGVLVLSTTLCCGGMALYYALGQLRKFV